MGACIAFNDADVINKPDDAGGTRVPVGRDMCIRRAPLRWKRLLRVIFCTLFLSSKPVGCVYQYLYQCISVSVSVSVYQSVYQYKYQNQHSYWRTERKRARLEDIAIAGAVADRGRAAEEAEQAERKARQALREAQQAEINRLAEQARQAAVVKAQKEEDDTI